MGFCQNQWLLGGKKQFLGALNGAQVRISSLSVTGSTTVLLSTPSPVTASAVAAPEGISCHSRWKISIGFLALLKVATTCSRAARKEAVDEDPIASCVAFKPSASLNLGEGTSKGTRE